MRREVGHGARGAGPENLALASVRLPYARSAKALHKFPYPVPRAPSPAFEAPQEAPAP